MRESSRNWVQRLTIGRARIPGVRARLPESRISTALEWDDLILPESAREQIAELEKWVRYHRALMKDWRMAGRIQPGYRALFHGPRGTGKTLTAALLGKSTGRDVYRVDLSSVVSKYIGETEKNLDALFDRARGRDSILFFDEADALFGKRTDVRDAHDRYANAEIAYLLQRAEDFDGLAILASNSKENMDDAFLRRIDTVIAFALPSEDERRVIWQRALPDREGRERLAELLSRFELSGGNIVDVIRFAGIEAIAAGRETIDLRDAVKGVKREMEKEGRVFRNLLEAELATRDAD